MTAEEQRQFDGLVVFWKHARDNITERRKYEWRLTYAIWTALGSLSITLIIKDFALNMPSLSSGTFSGVLILGTLSIIFSSVCYAHFQFLKGIGSRHNHDRKLSWAVLKAIKEIPGLSLPETYMELLELSPPAPSIRDWSRRVQFSVTCGLALMDVTLFAMRLLSSTSVQPGT